MMDEYENLQLITVSKRFVDDIFDPFWPVSVKLRKRWNEPNSLWWCECKYLSISSKYYALIIYFFQAFFFCIM